MVGLGFNQKTGQILDGFDNVKQSLAIILTTPLKTRVMRREFGCELFDLIDRPMNDKVILAAYASIVYACSIWEPRYEITQCLLSNADANGVITLSLSGNYYPRGHLGDKSKVTRDVPFSILLEKNK